MPHSVTSAHVTPDPVYPRLHVHVNEPVELAHAACVPQLCTPSMHSLLFAHDVPLPEKSALQIHTNELTVLEHVACPAEQSCVFTEHSLMSIHTTLLPV
jgi:hypothetical protein